MLEPGQHVPALGGQPVFGHPVRVPGGASGPAGGHLVVFVGHLVEARARALLLALQARVREAEARRVGLVGLTSASEALASDFVPRYHLIPPLLVDPDGTHHRAWQVPALRGRGGRGGRARALLGGSPEGWMEALTLGLGREARADWAPTAIRVDAEGRVLAVGTEAGSDALDLDGLLACGAS